MLTDTDSLAEGKAQTIVQLLNQMQRQGYQREALESAHRAYGAAVSLCSCQYRSSGRLLIDHSIGAASILAGLAVDAVLVTAGVVHAVYLHGDFGGWRRRVDERKRARIRAAAGDDAEEIVYRYSHSERNPLQLAAMRSRGTPATGERDLILMRLADLLDIYGEPDALYCHNLDKRRAVAGGGAEIAALASDLGFPDLGAALERGFARVRDGSGSIPAALRTPAWKDGIVFPPSYRVPMPIAAYQRLRSGIYSLVGR